MRSGATRGGATRDAVTVRPSLLLPVLAAVVALAVVIGAALAGPWRLTDPGTEEPPPLESVDVPTVEPPPELNEPVERTEGSFPFTAVLVVIGLVLLALALRALINRASFVRGGDGPAVETPTGSVVPGDITIEPDLPALRRGVAAAREVLAGHTEPDDAIIAAWLELESAAASSGVERAPSDTPTEFTTAVLDATRAEAQATRTLLGLYHRARFAPHAVMGAAEVAQAGRCLERIAESWHDT